MKDSTITENIDIQQCWNRIRQAQVFKSVSYPVWKYLQGQNVEAVVDRQREVLCDVLLASSLEAEDPKIAFAVRDAESVLKNILMLEFTGVLSLSNVKKHYSLVSPREPIVGCSVHFGEPKDELAVAVSLESAMAVNIASAGIACWACLGTTGMRTLRIPERVRKVCIYADMDPTEVMQEAAQSLAQRLRAQDCQAEVRFPPCSELGLSGRVSWHNAWMLVGCQCVRLES